jgi:hypothetical protein
MRTWHIQNIHLPVDIFSATKVSVFDLEVNPTIESEVYVIEYSEYEKLKKENEVLREHLKLALSFAPKGPVPEGLSPMFYHTLNYQDEVILQARIDKAREALEQADKIRGDG